MVTTSQKPVIDTKKIKRKGLKRNTKKVTKTQGKKEKEKRGMGLGNGLYVSTIPSSLTVVLIDLVEHTRDVG